MGLKRLSLKSKFIGAFVSFTVLFTVIFGGDCRVSHGL